MEEDLSPALQREGMPGRKSREGVKALLSIVATFFWKPLDSRFSSSPWVCSFIGSCGFTSANWAAPDSIVQVQLWTGTLRVCAVSSLLSIGSWFLSFFLGALELWQRELRTFLRRRVPTRGTILPFFLIVLTTCLLQGSRASHVPSLHLWMTPCTHLFYFIFVSRGHFCGSEWLAYDMGEWIEFFFI